MFTNGHLISIILAIFLVSSFVLQEANDNTWLIVQDMHSIRDIHKSKTTSVVFIKHKSSYAEMILCNLESNTVFLENILGS